MIFALLIKSLAFDKGGGKNRLDARLLFDEAL